MSLDKKADTILKHYLKAVDTFGLPSRVRFDFGVASGDPLTDVTELERMKFVMKSGVVYRAD